MNQAENAGVRARTLRWVMIGTVVALSGLGLTVILLAIRWPFSKQRTTSSLERALQSKVGMARFETSYFPHPGCVIHGLTVTRSNSNHQTTLQATADTVTIRAGYLDFFLRPKS